MTLTRKRSINVFILLALLILSANISLMKLTAFKPITDTMALATILDLTVCLPLFFYLLVVKGKGSLLKVLPVIIAGFWVAYFIVPHDNMPYLKDLVKGIYVLEAAFIAIELFLIVMLLRKLPVFIRSMREYKTTEHLFPFMLRKSLHKIFGESSKFVNFVVTDLSIFYYGLTSWKKKWIDRDGISSFSIHKNTGYFGIFIMLIHAMVIEVIGVHFLIYHWNETAAWIFTAFDLFFLFAIIADYHAIRLSPILIDGRRMSIQMGVRSSLEVNLANIQSIGQTETPDEVRKKEEQSFFVTLPEFLDDQPPQYEITLKEPETAYMLFGVKKKINKIYVNVDDPSGFYQKINEAIEKA